MAVPFRLARSPQVIFQEVSGEMVLLDLASEQYFGLDEVGARIWQLIDEHAEWPAMIPVLLDEYDVEETRLREDVERLLNELMASGLLQASG
ncbi:PqqD family protein [Haliea sp. E17]|uniref:PqqD family protein n=1 Tax=Haliea sp. E17 TaxID=3401576 RepID=UPI003AAE0EB2